MDRHVHSTKCTGCPLCNEEYGRVMEMAPAKYAEWLTDQAGVPPAPTLQDFIKPRRAALVLAVAKERTSASGDVPLASTLEDFLRPHGVLAAVQEENFAEDDVPPPPDLYAVLGGRS